MHPALHFHRSFFGAVEVLPHLVLLRGGSVLSNRLLPAGLPCSPRPMFLRMLIPPAQAAKVLARGVHMCDNAHLVRLRALRLRFEQRGRCAVRAGARSGV